MKIIKNRKKKILEFFTAKKKNKHKQITKRTRRTYGDIFSLLHSKNTMFLSFYQCSNVIRLLFSAKKNA